MRTIAACILLTLACACQPTQPPPASPTAVRVTATFWTATPLPTITITPVPTVTVQPTPLPGGFRMPTARAIPVGSVDVTAWVCHDANYWWDVTPRGMTLHEDLIGERLCLGLKTL